MRTGPNDGGSGDEDFPGAGQAASGGDNMCGSGARPFGEHHRSTSEGAASSVGGGDMDQSSAGNTSTTRWSNSSRYTPSLAPVLALLLNDSIMFCTHLMT